MATIAERLRAIADEIEGAGGGVVLPKGPPLLETGPDQPTWSEDPDGNWILNKAAEDFFVKGRLSAKKGAYQGHYAQAHTVLGMLGGDVERHLNVVVPADPAASWAAAVIRAADPELLWVGDGNYRPDASLTVRDNYARYLRAGSPTKNLAGDRFDQRGQIVDPKDWDRVYGRIGGGR